MNRTGFADLTRLGASATATETFFFVPPLDSKKAILVQVLTTYLRSPQNAFTAVKAIWRFYQETVHNSIAIFEVARLEIFADRCCRLIQMGRF
jgi:hypothetical protein